jgi:hypothetical protein
MHEITDADRLEERHLVHERGHGRPTGMPLGDHPGDIINQLHDDAAVNGAEKVRVEHRHDPAQCAPRGTGRLSRELVRRADGGHEAQGYV